MKAHGKKSFLLFFFLCWNVLVCCRNTYKTICPFSSPQASEENWANRLQSDETVTETQTPVSSSSGSFFSAVWWYRQAPCLAATSPVCCVFIVEKWRPFGSARQSRCSLLKRTLWLISVSIWGRGWGRKKSKVRANNYRVFSLWEWIGFIVEPTHYHFILSGKTQTPSLGLKAGKSWLHRTKHQL